MNNEITRLREQLVELSKDPIETRKLLDKLSEEEINYANIKSHFHVGEKDIEETKDFDHYVVHRVKNGYLLHYRCGYSILVDDKVASTCSALQMLMEGIPTEVKDEDERKAYEAALSAIEMVFRLPMFVFSNNNVTFTAAEVGLRYLLYLQNNGEVPTPESENEEYDKFILQMNEILENFATGLEKEGKEYEKRMGYGETERESESTGKGEGESKEA